MYLPKSISYRYALIKNPTRGKSNVTPNLLSRDLAEFDDPPPLLPPPPLPPAELASEPSPSSVLLRALESSSNCEEAVSASVI